MLYKIDDEKLQLSLIDGLNNSLQLILTLVSFFYFSDCHVDHNIWWFEWMRT